MPSLVGGWWLVVAAALASLFVLEIESNGRGRLKEPKFDLAPTLFLLGHLLLLRVLNVPRRKLC